MTVYVEIGEDRGTGSNLEGVYLSKKEAEEKADRRSVVTPYVLDDDAVLKVLEKRVQGKIDSAAGWAYQAQRDAGNPGTW